MAFPEDISVPFLLGETKESSITTVIKSAKNLSEHIRTHYGIYASQGLEDGVSNFSTVDLLYYHVYGDYRLTLLEPASSSAPDFLKTPSPEMVSSVYRYISAPPQNIPSLKGRANGRFFEDYLLKEVDNEDKLKGVLLPDEAGKPPLSTGQSATEWFQRELAFKSAASKFHLPSLGTMAVSTMGVKNTADKIRKVTAELITTMYEFIEDNLTDDQIPQFLRDPFDATAAPLSASRAKNNKKLIHAIHDALVNNLEYLKLRTDYPDAIPDDVALKEACIDSYKFDNGEEAADAYVKKLLAVTQLKFNLGMPVKLTVGGAAKHAPLAGLTIPEVTAGDWVVTNAQPSKGGKKGPKGIFTVRDSDGNVITDVLHSELQSRIVDLEDAAMAETAATKKKYLANATSLVFFRVVLDVLFTFETVLYAANIPYQTAKLDNSINITNQLTGIEKRYPNMQHIYEEPFSAGFIKDKPGSIDTFSALRTTHTLAHLANLDSAYPKLGIEEFYKQDLRLSEVLWMAQALTDEGKAVLERKEKPNLLAQLQYTARGIGPGVSAEAPVGAKTIFYQMDSPILKDVIMAYDQLFIDFTITNSFMPKDKKKKKKGGGGGAPPVTPDEDNIRISELANSLWGSIAGRSSDILNREGVKPHIIFSRLFGQMEKQSSKVYAVAENYPSQWTGTNTVTKLSRDPITLGEEIDMKYYSDRMNEYIQHLKNNFIGVPQVAQLVLTVLGDIVIQTEGNIDTLRESFIARIKSQASRPMLKGTANRFDAYRAIMCVMRSEIDIPLRFREAFVAQALDESQREQLKKTFSDESKALVLPEDHPEFKPGVIDDESALYGSDNPNKLPLPGFYPKAGSRLNRNNAQVEEYLEGVIGLPPGHPSGRGVVGFPTKSFQATFSATLNAAQIETLKERLMSRPTVANPALPMTEYFVEDIDWKGATERWDGRDDENQKPHPSVVAHYRDNLGVLLTAKTPGYPDIPLDFVPSKNLTKYDSILYKKYNKDRFDQPGYVYIPPDLVFKNPGAYHSYTPSPIAGMPPLDVSSSGDPFDLTSGTSVMIYRGDLAQLTASLSPTVIVPPMVCVTCGLDPCGCPEPYEHTPILEELEDINHSISYAGTQSSVDMDRNTAELTKIATAVDGAGSKFADAGESFERAGESFERAGVEFSEAGRHYEIAAQAFRDMPDALRDALVEASTSFIDEIENRFGPLEDFDPEVNPEIGRAAEGALGGMVVIGGGHIEGAVEAIQNISLMLPEIAYRYRNFTTHLQDMYLEDRTANNFLSAPSKKKTGKQVRSWVSHSLSVAYMTNFADLSITQEQENNLPPKELKALLWRRHCISVIGMMIPPNPDSDPDYEGAMRELGIEDWEDPAEVEVEEDNGDGGDGDDGDDDDGSGPSYFERKREEVRARLEDLKDDVEEAGGFKEILKAVKG